ncbi:hypothetical protein [Planococcus sp. MB-3u-03]|uniref:hypothetical protein n=1 Tax=Planococcus sp. MB-3u-03 TaxID=2058136 RepID=UPI001E30B1B9|nr:hypothetical protein [Planococcus sp. MB-3u-03]
MISQLSKIYPSLQVYTQGASAADPEYKWFSGAEGVVVGIHETELAQKDLSLLSAFLTPYNPQFPIRTDEKEMARCSKFSHTRRSDQIPIGFFISLRPFSIQKNRSVRQYSSKQ